MDVYPGGADAVAKALGISSQFLYMLMKGTNRASLDLASAIEDLLGIPMKKWARPQRARKRVA